MTWREQYAPIIAGIIRKHGDPADKIARQRIRRDLRESYPYSDGAGKNSHQYKAWLTEARIQMGRAAVPRDRGRPPAVPLELSFPDPFQKSLFDDGEKPPEIRLIDAVIDAAAKGHTAAAIHKAVPHLVSYFVAVRILELHSKFKKTPEQILRYLEADEAQRRFAATFEGIGHTERSTPRQPK